MRSELKAQLTAKDGQINSLVQEQAAMQAQLSEAQSQLQQVCLPLHSTTTIYIALSCSCNVQQRVLPAASSQHVHDSCSTCRRQHVIDVVGLRHPKPYKPLHNT